LERQEGKRKISNFKLEEKRRRWNSKGKRRPPKEDETTWVLNPIERPSKLDDGEACTAHFATGGRMGEINWEQEKKNE